MFIGLEYEVSLDFTVIGRHGYIPYLPGACSHQPTDLSLFRSPLPSSLPQPSNHHHHPPCPTLPINHHPPIRVQALATNRTTIHTRQPHKAARDLARLAGPSHRAAELLLCVLIHRRGNERRPHRPGADGVNADPFAELLVREPAREGHDGALGGSVVKQIGAPDIRVDGRVVDDRVAGGEVWEAVFGEVEVGVDVGGEGVEPLVSGGDGRG